MYTEYNSENMNQENNFNNQYQSYSDDNDNGEDTGFNKIFGVIWKILLVILVLLLLFLGLIQFKVITLSSDVAPDSIVLNVNEIGIKKGDGYQLVSTILPENANNKQIIYESSNPEVASVNDTSGYIKGLKTGSAIITAKTIINDKESQCVVNVEDGGVTVQSISLNNKNVSLAAGYTYGLSYNVTPSNATELNVKFYSSDSSVATVDSNGTIQGIREGNAIITVSLNNNSITDTAYVTVYKKGTTTTTQDGETVKTVNYPKSVSLSSTSLNLTKGSTNQLQANITPIKSISDLVWKSSNPKVATVDGNGLITAVGEGTADIVVSTVNNLTASCKVNVGSYSVKTKGIKILTDYVQLSVGSKTKPLTVLFEPSNATNRTIAWSSSNSQIATVNSNGVVTGVSSGSATITAKSVETGLIATVKVDVIGSGNVIEINSISFAKSKYEVGLNSTDNLIINYNPSNATYYSVYFTSSNNNVATVDSSGLVKGVGIGTATITATAKRGEAKATTTINVKNIPSTSVSLNKTELNLKVNDLVTLSATVLPKNASDKTVIFASNNQNVVTVDKDGTIRAVGQGTAIITVTPNGGGSSSTCIVKVS